jgi:DNA invertase Pin-like site-specific DNA recombinase
MHALVIAVTQNIETDESNSMARFLLHIMAAFAELSAGSSAGFRCRIKMSAAEQAAECDSRLRFR